MLMMEISRLEFYPLAYFAVAILILFRYLSTYFLFLRFLSSSFVFRNGRLGNFYFLWQAMYHQLRLEPYAVHTTFQYAGTEGKRHRLREGMVFYDPPEYYDSLGKIILC